jgi:hypothetical protein
MKGRHDQWIEGGKMVVSVRNGGAVTLQNIVKCIKYQLGWDSQ